jgi:hypothetical protein
MRSEERDIAQRKTVKTGGEMRGDVPESAHQQYDQKKAAQKLHNFVDRKTFLERSEIRDRLPVVSDAQSSLTQSLLKTDH